MNDNIRLFQGDCIDVMQGLIDEGTKVDLTVTSPPYDNLRTYKNSVEWNFDVFKKVADALYRITADGGVVVWVVGDSTVKGSESGTSFRQALYFKEIGFNLHDTMIYRKQNYMPLTHNRYEQEFEYMFVFSKGKPKTFNPIMVDCKYAGTAHWGNVTFHKTNDSGLVDCGNRKVNDRKQHGNIFTYLVGKVYSHNGVKHPAPFPEKLAEDQILSWSNEGDTVLDCFMGSGTTGKMAYLNGRKFIGIEKVDEYFDMAEKRIEAAEAERQMKKNLEHV